MTTRFNGASNSSNGFEAIAAAILAVTFMGVFVTLFFLPITATLFALGWNYGITEVIEALGGPDANINWLVAGFTVIGLGLIRGSGNISASKD